MNNHMGWECPRCHTCYAPFVSQCNHCAPHPVQVVPNLTVLTERERQMYDLFAQGVNVDEIAKRLGIKRKTADVHLQGVRSKLGFKNMREFRKSLCQ